MVVEPGDTYDLFLSHRSLDKVWVETLARNLRARGYRVFYDDWVLVPGRPFVDALARGLESSRKAVLVATPEAVESGWVRLEYGAMVARGRRDPEFSFVPLVFGEVHELRMPFLETVQCVDFRDPAAGAYRRAFRHLLCGLEDQPPGADAELDGELEIPEPLHFAPEAPAGSVAAATSETEFLDEIFETASTNPILMLLAQSDLDQRGMIAGIRTRAQGLYGEAGTLHVTPPYSADAELGQYFARLGRQCGFEEEIGSSADWDDALDLRLSRGEWLFLLVNGFEHGSELGRRQLAGTLRRHSERHGLGLKVVLCGGERLAELKYAQGQMSLLNLAEELVWPETSVADVLAWQWRHLSGLELGQEDAQRLLALCGGHPRLVRHCLEARRRDPDAGEGADRRALEDYAFLWQLFTPFRAVEEERERLCSWLAGPDLGVAEPWPADPLLRRLYWNNLLVERQRRFLWRCRVLREVGQRVLGCTD